MLISVQKVEWRTPDFIIFIAKDKFEESSYVLMHKFLEQNTKSFQFRSGNGNQLVEDIQLTSFLL